MRLRRPKRFYISKNGNRPDEYEDYSRIFFPAGNGGFDTARIALADGASESAFSRVWAKILGDAFVDRPFDLASPTQSMLESWLKPCQGQWHNAVPWDRLPWHGEVKAQAGALATLLAMTIQPNSSRRLSWQAAAVGDSCLFVVRQNDLLLSFPLESADQFNSTPALISSNRANNSGLWEHVRQSNGESAPGDLFMLASDALACWILDRYSAGEKPWEPLWELDSRERWTDLVQTQRREHSLKNDDTTLIMIEVA